MKTIKILTGLAALLLLISGCIPSLHPLYTEEDIVFEESLLGTWGKTPETWTFSTDDSVSYDLTIISEEDTTYLEVHMVILNGHYFMDFYPEDNDHIDIPDHLVLNLLAVHTFARVSFDGYELKVRYFDPSWLDTLFEQNRIRIKHEVLDDDNIVLTAPTDELQKFVSKYADDPKAFTSADTYNKLLQ